MTKTKKSKAKPAYNSNEATVKRENNRARRWKRTGVSEATIRWMRDSGML